MHTMRGNLICSTNFIVFALPYICPSLFFYELAPVVFTLAQNSTLASRFTVQPGRGLGTSEL
jgi:hypothetical protein